MMQALFWLADEHLNVVEPSAIYVHLLSPVTTYITNVEYGLCPCEGPRRIGQHMHVAVVHGHR